MPNMVSLLGVPKLAVHENEAECVFQHPTSSLIISRSAKGGSQRPALLVS
ncbi:MAG: hypothetical protein Q4D38_05390 [Planctomycetia bacterium]|nr:hypothetical protein [Planctomycetia bacterium]